MVFKGNAELKDFPAITPITANGTTNEEQKRNKNQEMKNKSQRRNKQQKTS